MYEARSSARNPVFERNVNECLGDLSTLDVKESQAPRVNQLNPPKTQSPVVAVSLTEKERGVYSPFPDRREPLTKPVELPQGTLEMLVLKAVSLGPLHGYGVLLRIQQISGEQLVIQQGSLYPALYRLEHEGAIKSEWGESDNNRRAKYYTLTPAGRKQLATETEKWNRMAGIIGGILQLTGVES
jgi:transcriptional regulator